MQSKPLLRHVLQDEGLTRGLGDAEARVVIEWLVDWAEILAEDAESEEDAWAGIRLLCRRARGIARFVSLWFQAQSRAAAIQLAATERFSWPFPKKDEEPIELIVRLLVWEDRLILIP